MLKYTYENTIKFMEYVHIIHFLPPNRLKYCDESHFASRGSCCRCAACWLLTNSSDVWWRYRRDWALPWHFGSRAYAVDIRTHGQFHRDILRHAGLVVQNVHALCGLPCYDLCFDPNANLT